MVRCSSPLRITSHQTSPDRSNGGEQRSGQAASRCRGDHHRGVRERALTAAERSQLVLNTQLALAAQAQHRLLPALPDAGHDVRWAARLQRWKNRRRLLRLHPNRRRRHAATRRRRIRERHTGGAAPGIGARALPNVFAAGLAACGITASRVPRSLWGGRWRVVFDLRRCARRRRMSTHHVCECRP
jgi:hypothetical protein